MYGIDMMDTWLYDDHCPFDYLKQLAVFDFLKKQVGTGYYEDLIRTGLLNNPHTSLVVIEPEKGLNDRMEEELAKKLAAYKESLTAEEKQALVEKTENLHSFPGDTVHQRRAGNHSDAANGRTSAKEAYTFSNLRRAGRRDNLRPSTMICVTNGVGYVDLVSSGRRYVPAEYDSLCWVSLKAALGSSWTRSITPTVNCASEVDICRPAASPASAGG